MKHLLIIFLFLLSINFYGQTFNKKYFASTSWFSNNDDSLFYKADTVRLIKYSNKAPQRGLTKHQNRRNYAESECCTHYCVLYFLKHKKMVLNDIHRVEFMPNEAYGGVTWSFNIKTNQLSIYDWKKAIIVSFRPISEKQIENNSGYWEIKNPLKTTELTVVRIK